MPIIKEISMVQIRLATLALLFMSVVAFHTTMPKEDIIFIPAQEGPIKISAYTSADSLPKVVSLEEADRLYNERYGSQPLEEYEIDHSQCWFNDCDLEVSLWLAKYYLIEIFQG